MVSSLMEPGSLTHLVYPRVGGPNKNSWMVRNAYKTLRNQVLKVRGTESWTGSLPTNIQDSGWGENTVLFLADCPWLTHCRPQTNTEGTVHDPLMSHPALASPWCRQQETHFHKGAEISSSINNTAIWSQDGFSTRWCLSRGFGNGQLLQRVIRR